MKNTLAVLIILLFTQCFEKNDKAYSDEFYEFRFLNKNKKDSTIVKYLKDEESLLLIVKYMDDSLMKVKKIHKNGNIEKYMFSLVSGRPFGDHYIYDNDGKLIRYSYINPEHNPVGSLFNYNNTDGQPEIIGTILVEHVNFGDSIELVFPLIEFVKYDIKISEISQNISEEGLKIENFSEGSLIYNVLNPSNDLSIDIYAKGFYPDSVIHQHYYIVSEIESKK